MLVGDFNTTVSCLLDPIEKGGALKGVAFAVAGLGVLQLEAPQLYLLEPLIDG